MKVFIDIFSGDEVLSDGVEFNEEYEGTILSVTSKMVVADDAGNVDIGCGNEFGGNEDDGEPNDPNVEKVNNVISSYNLSEYFGSKKDLMALFKERITQMKEKLKDEPERLKNWEKGGEIEKFIKVVFGKFDDCQFYMGSSLDNENPTEGMPVVAFWKDESDSGETFFYFKDCLRVTKV